MKAYRLALFVTLLVAAPLSADILHLQDGRLLHGRLLHETSDQVIFLTSAGAHEFPAAQIRQVYVEPPAVPVCLQTIRDPQANCNLVLFGLDENSALVSGTDSRRGMRVVSRDEIVSLEFRAPPGDPAIGAVLRPGAAIEAQVDGQTMRGRVTQITRNLIRLETAQGPREFDSAQVGSVALGPPASQAAQADTATTPAAAVLPHVPANDGNHQARTPEQTAAQANEPAHAPDAGLPLYLTLLPGVPQILNGRGDTGALLLGGELALGFFSWYEYTAARRDAAAAANDPAFRLTGRSSIEDTFRSHERNLQMAGFGMLLLYLAHLGQVLPDHRPASEWSLRFDAGYSASSLSPAWQPDAPAKRPRHVADWSFRLSIPIE